MIKINYIDDTWVMPQNFVQIRPNYNKMENSVKKNVANGFHSLTKEDFRILETWLTTILQLILPELVMTA